MFKSKTIYLVSLLNAVLFCATSSLAYTFGVKAHTMQGYTIQETGFVTVTAKVAGYDKSFSKLEIDTTTVEVLTADQGWSDDRSTKADYATGHLEAAKEFELATAAASGKSAGVAGFSFPDGADQKISACDKAVIVFAVPKNESAKETDAIGVPSQVVSATCVD